MYEGLLNSAIPVLFALIFVTLICASILLTVRPPTDSKERRSQDRLYPRWGHLEREPEGTRKSGAPGVKAKIKVA